LNAKIIFDSHDGLIRALRNLAMSLSISMTTWLIGGVIAQRLGRPIATAAPQSMRAAAIAVVHDRTPAPFPTPGTKDGSSSRTKAVRPILKFTRCVLLACSLGGCASLPPGADFPKIRSVALSEPQTTRLGSEFAAAAHERGEKSGYRIISIGVDGFLMRMEMINTAERTLDLQYFILRGDESGRLLTDALIRAADRGVRVRLLLDDGETVAGDEQIFAIAGRANVQIRLFNPFAYRGHNRLVKGAEYLLNHSRLDYRMHNKLLVTDNSIALVGGRNIGDQYFQIDPESQFADADVFAAGPIVRELSGKFDDFWNSALAIPAEALHGATTRARHHEAHTDKVNKAGFDYQSKLDSGEPLAGLITGRVPLIWADAQVVCDSPDKKRVTKGAGNGSLLYEAVAHAAAQVRSELLIVTPYVIPSKDELRLLEDRRRHGARIRILTNSLESAPELSAHSGYMHYRTRLLNEGVELYEVRSQLGSSRGSGQSTKLSRYGNYALHAKLYVLDRQRLFIGSMNLDRRSRRLNTEVGLIIDSTELSQETTKRFEAMTLPENSYTVALLSDTENPPVLVWRTAESGVAVEYKTEPARNEWQRIEVKFLSLLPLDSEL
jgi:putative cardiolipin synthase